MKKELSIIVPVYNVEKYLRECLNSIYAIKDIDKEVILINDGSTDGSLKILEEYKNSYSEITKLINKKNGGVASARNTGIKVAEGEYISFIDSDDWIDSKKYEKVFKKIKIEKLDAIMGVPIVYENNNFTKRKNSEKVIRNIIEEGIVFFENNIKSFLPLLEVWNYIYKREILVDNNIYFKEGIIYEDELFTPIVLSKVKKIRGVVENFYYYRVRERSIMHKYGNKDYNSKHQIYMYLLFKSKIDSEILIKEWFWLYQEQLVSSKVLILKDYIKLLFFKKINFKEKIVLLKTLKYINQIKWRL